MDSVFNSAAVAGLQTGEMVEIGSSLRFRYYKARRNGILHFIKAPTEEYANDLLTIESLRKEFLLGYGLNHPGFVRYYSLEENTLYEEYIEGMTLRQIIDSKDKRLFQRGFIENVCRQILEALRYLHSQGILHLDLKPENVMVANVGLQVKIIDLSCAKSDALDSTSGYTSGYSAPEQEKGEVNQSTDIYHVGLIVKELAELAGKKKWKRFISRASSIQPESRYKNAEDAIAGIPNDKYNFRRWAMPLLLFLITAGIISVIIGNSSQPKENIYPREKAEDTEEPSGTDTPVVQTEETEKESQPETGVVNSPSVYPQKEESENKRGKIERKLAKLIDVKLENLYSIDVTPMYEKMMADENYKREVGTAVFINAYTAAFGQLKKYGEELKKEYPGYDDFIDAQIRTTFENRTYKMNEKLMPPSNIKPFWEREEDSSEAKF